MGISPEQAAVFQELDAQGLLELRVAGYLWGNDGLEGAAYEELARSDAGRRFRVAGVKLMIDGALGSRGAALLEPYSDAPLERGLLQLEPARLRGLVARSAELGLQPAVHAIGDRGNRVVLDAFAAVLSDSAGLRPRVEHAQVLAPVDWNRLDALGAVPSMQPRHATSDMRWAERRLGPERMAGAYAWRRLASARVPLALGSDFPVEPSAPLLGLYAARTRQDEQGSPPGGFQPEQRLSGVEALEGFTAGASFALGEEHERGRLLVGYFADMTVLDVDPVKAPAERLLGAKILATVIEGCVVYSAP
jgi:predicted amidohydrolase YtcJ